MSSIGKFLTPISEENPAGEDLTWDPVLTAMRTAARPKITQRIEDGKQISVAEEPDYRKLLATCEQALVRSRNIEVAIYYCIARTEINGLEGAVEGLELVAGLFTNFWPLLHPLPDEDERDVFSQRLGILTSLSPKPQNEDTLKFVTRLRRTRLVGRVTLGDYEKTRTSGATQELTDEFQANFREASGNSDAVQSCMALVLRLEAALKGIEDFLIEKKGASTGLETLRDCIHSIKALVSRLAPQSTNEDIDVEPAIDAVRREDAVPSTEVKKSMKSGVLSSNQDVIRMLDEICAYYLRSEPASPVPLLLQRAKRLVGKSFLEIMDDITEPAVGVELRKLAGISSTEAT